MSIWSKQASPPLYIYGTEANRFITSAVQYFPKQAKIAAYEEKEGANAVFLAKLGHQITVYDSTSSGLAKVQLLARMNGVSIITIRADLIEYELPQETYDGAIMVFGHFQHKFQLVILEKIMNSIKLNGVFMFEVYEYAQLLYKTGGPNEMAYLYNAEDILRWARRYKLKHYFTGEVEQYEVSFQTNTRRVIQVIVEK
ncbi:bifunctional 2-polyprenyl-6-hydroxyphenol methylase/3-demethylubiquinol 3-O-methyltransferase UbiG [Lysinibacillus sp. K60]|uniref:class I SAM-dependent methyltransferase n=1 Tax=Lysinibacillus sp. K60 TaxID=2720027 RepID=UPI001C8B296C|nr:class I SAM-dependent methyltransferase [Lysinibacillus sp. K60]MBX8946866.1 class I SAM-dependent methyltransferase [Lysinibacillus sp. K60]